MIFKQRVTAIFKDEGNAKDALKHLEDKGYKSEHVNLLMSKKTFEQKHMKFLTEAKIPEGASVGAGMGGLAGGLAAALVAVGSATLSGGMSVFAAGPIVAALAGAGVGSAAGGMIGALLGLGFSEKDARYIDERLSEGDVVVDVALEEEDSKPEELKDELENKFKADVIYFQ